MLEHLPVIKNLSPSKRAIAITVGLLVLYELGSRLPLKIFFGEDFLLLIKPENLDRINYHFFDLGFTWVFMGFFYIEALSFFLPPFKKYRTQGRIGRNKLNIWSIGVSIVLTGYYAFHMVRSMPYLALPGQLPTNEFPLIYQILAFILLFVGFAGVCTIAVLITRQGIGNGFCVLIGYDIITSLPFDFYELFTPNKNYSIPLAPKNIMTSEPPNLVGILLFIFLLAVLYKKFWRGVPLPELIKKLRPVTLKTQARGKSIDFQLPYLLQGAFSLLWPYSIIMYIVQLIWMADGQMTSFHGSSWLYWFTYTFLLAGISYLSYWLVSHPDRIIHNTLGKITFQEGWQQKVQQSAIRSITVITLLWFFWNAPLGVLDKKSLLFGSLCLSSIIILAALVKDVLDQYLFLKNAENPQVLEIFDNVHFVTVLKGQFEAEGIRFCVQAFEYRRLFYFFEPLIKMRVLVDARDWDKAKALADLENVTII